MGLRTEPNSLVIPGISTRAAWCAEDRAIGRNSESTVLHRSSATGHRGWNRQPVGTSTGFGVSPFRIWGGRAISGIALGNHGEQRFRVGMLRVPHDVTRWTFLDDPAQVHNHDAICEVRCGREVVRDHEHAHVPRSAHAVQQRQRAGPHGHVEHGNGLVGNEELGIQHQAGRDRNPLPLVPRKLVRIPTDIQLRRGELGSRPSSRATTREHNRLWTFHSSCSRHWSTRAGTSPSHPTRHA